MRQGILALLALLAMMSPAAAQNVSLSFHGGAGFPVSPAEFADYWSTGYTVGGGMSYYVLPFLKISGDVAYSEFPFDAIALLKEEDVPPGLVEITGGAVSGIFLTGSLKIIPFPDATVVRPYTRIGGGFAALSVSDVTVSALNISETVSGASEKAATALFGAGLDVVLSPSFDLFIEGQYIIAFTEEDHLNLVPATLGFRIKF